MAKFIYGLNQSLDGFVDHARLGPPDPVVFRHFIEHVRGSAGLLYSRRTYEIMRYWTTSDPIGTLRDAITLRYGEANRNGWFHARCCQSAPTRHSLRMTSWWQYAGSRLGLSARSTSPDRTWREALPTSAS